MSRWIAGFALLGTIIAVSTAEAQIAASLKVVRRMHLTGEPVIAVVTVTNHAGRPLIFQSEGRFQWLVFSIKDGNGNAVNASFGTKTSGPMKIEAGQTLAREVDLSEHFQLSRPGNYQVSATVREPGQENQATVTNKAYFIQSTGRTVWSQRVGVGGMSGAVREFRLIHFTDEQKSHLYAQIQDGASGRMVRTFRLGEALMLRRPIVTVDKQQRMHVLYLGTPSMWVHCVVDTDGRLVARQIHQRGPQGDPQLVTVGDGSVRVANSIPYDPAAAEREKGTLRKATDRPAITY